MRRFFSYGPLNPKPHYYAPRETLIEKAYTTLVGENPQEGGHYITVWGPRQCGSTWVMLEVLRKIEETDRFHVVKLDLEHLKTTTDIARIVTSIAKDISRELDIKHPLPKRLEEFQEFFSRDVLEKPLVLILDEFDALPEEVINSLAGIFRNIFNRRQKDLRRTGKEQWYRLHGLALIGVRSVLGIENVKGSPFNVQRSLHIPNLTLEEVQKMFQWYEKDSGQKVETEVVERLFYETRGQPGLIGWFGELFTEGFEGYANDSTAPIGIREFERVYSAAIYALPNNNILNIISKVKEEPNKTLLLELYKTEDKLEFTFDEPTINALYMNGVVDKEVDDDIRYYLRFSSPFVQKRLFNYFSRTLFKQMGRLVEPFLKLDHVITPSHLDIPGLMKLYQDYLDKNKSWLFKDVPRRSDLRVYEAVFHFNLYSYLDKFLQNKNGRVFPEFPTGNGKIDLLIRYNDVQYGIELKSFSDDAGYKLALKQAAQYGKQLQLSEIYLITFVESIDEANRQKYEAEVLDPGTKVTVKPVFIRTGRP